MADAPQTPTMTAEQPIPILKDVEMRSMKVLQLKEELAKRQLPVYGRKEQLVARLRAYTLLQMDQAVAASGPQGTSNEDDNDDDDVSKDDHRRDDGKGVEQTPVIRRRREQSEQPVLLAFRDVEESMDKFSGDDAIPVEKWIRGFEEVAEASGWSDVHRVMYAKKLLKGSAMRFVKYEDCSKTWEELRSALEEEFGGLVDSFQVHQRLARERKRNDESLHEFVYRMLEIAAQADVEAVATIKYIIEGIPDDATNKVMLFGASTIKELKAKLVQYEQLKQSMKSRPRTTDDKKKTGNREVTKPVKSRTCFNCGDKDHISRDCPTREKGTKCFKCGEHGHIAPKCPKTIKVTNAVAGSGKKQCMKDIKINDQTYKALIDTGSDLTFIRTDEYMELGAPSLKQRQIKFEGLGTTNNVTLGEFTTKVEINGERFHGTFHVVPGRILKHAVLLGTDFLSQAELSIRKGDIKLKKIEDEKPDCFKIDLVAEKEEVDLTYVEDRTQKKEIETMIKSYKPEPTRDVGISTKIILKDDIPVVSSPRRLSVHEKIIVEQVMNEWLADGIIQPSTSEYASPIVLVKKKDGSTRVYVDYRAVNAKMEKLQYPLPIIEDQINALQGARVFTTLDLKNGYFHVPVSKESRKYTAFVTPTNQYEFLKTPFGLSIAPAVFQKFINTIFKDLISEKIVLAYMDDLIIVAENSGEAMERLKRVILVSQQHGLVINWKKSKFLRTEIEYLDHVITKDKVRPSESKFKAIEGFKMPVNIKTLQSFLGLTGYLRKFIQNYSQIAKPLTDLLKKDKKFHMGEKEVEAVQRLKAAIISRPVLRLYRIGAETELHTDASCHGYGMVLMQKGDDDDKWHPIYYASGKTTPAETKYSSYELEVLAVVKGLIKFRVYLLGIPFKIITDCQAFAMTMRKKELSPRIARWALLLQEYTYEVCHRPGRSMQHVDALSRNPLPTVLTIKECQTSILVRLRKAQKEDEDLKDKLQEAEAENEEGYVIKNDLLYKKVNQELLIVVPTKMQTQIIRQAHERGHYGVFKTELLILENYWFSGMRSKIENVTKNCVSCILAERKRGKQEGMIQPIDKGDRPLDTFHIDHVGPMALTQKRYMHLLVIVDAFTKFTWLYPTRSTSAAETIDKLTKQAATFGNPRRIITDRGAAFTSNAFAEYCKTEQIQHLLITTGIPRGNGQVERVNRTIIPILTKLTAPETKNWYKYVDKVQNFMNNSVCRSTRRTPFQLLTEVKMRVGDNPEIREIIEKEWIEEFNRERDGLRQIAKEEISKVQAENRRSANKKRKEAHRYQVGDLVSIRRTQFGAGLKLHGKFLGPYEVTKVMRHDRYMVKKVGEHEGPNETSSAADSMKRWIDPQDDDDLGKEEDVESPTIEENLKHYGENCQFDNNEE